MNKNGYKNETRYDLNGRVTSVKDANGNETTFAYDALGRTTSTQTELNRTTAFEYDNNGNQIQLTNAANSEIYKEYDELNRVILVRDAMNADTRYTYDLLGNRTSVTDAKNQTTTFVFNPLGRLVEEIDPVIETPDKTKTYIYDKTGNLISFTDRNGEVTHHTYDLMNRVVSIDYLSDATQTTITYDQYGDKTAIGNADVTYTYTYDNQHRLLSKTDSRTNQSLNWTYDAVGNVISKTDYLGNTTTFKYDSTNRLVASSNPAYLNAAYRYDGAGRLQSRILSSGAKTLYDYDKDNRLSKLVNYSADGTLVEERSYTRDALGNITNIAFNGGLSIAYTYDPNSRLLSADYSDDSYDVSYSYDDVGNRLTHTVGGMTVYYHYSQKGNRLLKICLDQNCNQPARHYAYDDNGSRIAKYDGINKLIESYTYNQQRLVTEITSSNGNTNFAYDANAFRIQKINSDNTENNYLLEAEHLEAVYDENNNLKASYLRGNIIDEIISGHEYHNGKKVSLTFHHDQINSVIALTDHNGAIKQTIHYDPFGATLSNNGNSENTLQYTGRENDANGLYYYRARYYDPETGRFISEDPLGFEAGINFYVYVENNPLNLNDPSGKCPNCVAGVVGGTIGGIAGATGEVLSNPDWTWGSLGQAAGVGAVTGVGVGLLGPMAITGSTTFLSSTFGLSTATSATISTASFGAVTGMAGDAAAQNLNIYLDIQSDWDYNRTAIAGVSGTIGTAFTVGGILTAVPAGVTFSSSGTSSLLAYSTGSVALGALDAGLGVTTNMALTGFMDTLSAISTSSSSSVSSSSANGGFVIYPNKINSNNIRSVYAK